VLQCPAGYGSKERKHLASHFRLVEPPSAVTAHRRRADLSCRGGSIGFPRAAVRRLIAEPTARPKAKPEPQGVRASVLRIQAKGNVTTPAPVP
jgi:hypothetical protein